MEKAPRYKCHIWRCSQVIISPTWRFYFTSWNKTVLYLLIFYPPFRLMVFLLAHASALYINCLHMNVSVIKTRRKELSTSVKRLSIFTEESLKHSFSLGVLLPLHRQLKFRGAFMHYILCKSPASFLEGTDLRKIKDHYSTTSSTTHVQRMTATDLTIQHCSVFRLLYRQDNVQKFGTKAHLLKAGAAVPSQAVGCTGTDWGASQAKLPSQQLFLPAQQVGSVTELQMQRQSMKVPTLIWHLQGIKLLKTAYRCFAKSSCKVGHKTDKVKVLLSSNCSTSTVCTPIHTVNAGGQRNREQINRNPKINWLHTVCPTCRHFLDPDYFVHNILHFEGRNPNVPSRLANAECIRANIRLPVFPGCEEMKIILPLVHTTAATCAFNTATVSFQLKPHRGGFDLKKCPRVPAHFLEQSGIL